jgi:serine/threonine protein kinase/ribosomal protein L40E
VLKWESEQRCFGDWRDSMAFKVCPNCGFKNSEDAHICERCGTSLDRTDLQEKGDETIRIDDDKTIRIRENTPDNSSFGFTTFRGYKVLNLFPAMGAEADAFLIEKNDQKFFLKLYRKGIEPKIEVLQKIKAVSEKLPQHVALIYEVGFDEETGRYFEVIEYIPGGNLKDLIKKIQNIPFEEKTKIIDKIVAELAEAINALHETNIVHRDLKPTNVLVRNENPLDLVLTDFGISREISEDLHVTTSFKGTLAYMAPEELSNYYGKEIDWWHLGVIVYEALMGKNPFASGSEQFVRHRLIGKGIEVPADIDKRYQLLLKGLLTRDRNKRWGYKQVRDWLNGKTDIPVYYELPAHQETDLNMWLRAGFTEESAKLWATLGLEPDEARKFKEYFNFSEAKEWINAGFKNFEEVKKWYEAGFSPEEAAVFEKFGLIPKDAKRLKDYGVTAYDLKRKYKPKNFNFSKVIEYLEAGFNPFSKDDDLEEWLKQGFNIHEASLWKKQNFQPEEAAFWKSYGFSPNDASRWREHGFNPQEASKYARKGFSPENAKRAIENRRRVNSLIYEYAVVLTSIAVPLFIFRVQLMWIFFVIFIITAVISIGKVGEEDPEAVGCSSLAFILIIILYFIFKNNENFKNVMSWIFSGVAFALLGYGYHNSREEGDGILAGFLRITTFIANVLIFIFNVFKYKSDYVFRYTSGSHWSWILPITVVVLYVPLFFRRNND